MHSSSAPLDETVSSGDHANEKKAKHDRSEDDGERIDSRGFIGV
jgi:hypothetical protein